jgi:uncharacterized membrane protein SirB2
MELLKWVHISFVLVSGCGFFARGILMLRASSLLQIRSVKILPHVVDSLLLASAIGLASQWGWAALEQPWLLTKIIALLLYIFLGMLALHEGRSRRLRVTAWLLALLVFFYIVAVAITKNPLLIT